MELRLCQPVSPKETADPEFEAIAARYDAHSSVRRLWAISDAFGLRVLVTLEPTHEDNDTLPAWLANCHAWAHELQSSTDQSVRLERLDAPGFDGTASDAESTLVAALSWRDPYFT